MFNLKNDFYLQIILVFSFIALISAFFIQYVLGHQPCNLCLIERIPYGLNIILLITIFTLKKQEKFLILMLIFTSVFSLLISIYHQGIEIGFIQESSICGSKNLSEILTKEDIFKQLNMKIISCKDVTFRIFGLSLTSINIVISLIFTITLLKIFIKYEKN